MFVSLHFMADLFSLADWSPEWYSERPFVVCPLMTFHLNSILKIEVMTRNEFTQYMYINIA